MAAIGTAGGISTVRQRRTRPRPTAWERRRELDARHLGPDSPHGRKRPGVRRKRATPRWPPRSSPHRARSPPITSSCAPRTNCKCCWTTPWPPSSCRLKITESRYRFGVAAKADVVSAETQLLSSQAQQINANIQRGDSRACHCRVDRPAAGRFLLEPHGDAHGCSDRARRSSLHASGAAARRRRSRAQGRGGQCPDRGGDCGLFSEPDAVRLRSVREQHARTT